MPTLYHFPMSSHSRFVRLILGEYNYQVELAEELTWEHRKDFLALNPAGTLPVLVDDSMRVLCGAYVILEFMDETAGILKRDKRLLDDDPFKRAEIRRLTEWFLTKMEQEVTRPLVRERVHKVIMRSDQGGGPPDSKVLRATRANIRQHMKYVAWLAGTRAYLAGDRFSYADLAAAASISVLDYMGEIDWGETPQAKEWYQRIKSRPCFRPLLAERIRGLTPVSHYADLDF
ncbi:glutathione S-transferase family protein [Rhizobium sp. L1K21]|uniref:glutathione S-transferase family protein n=1 Tax=Rhizobium sp. L1K21 TaxID=2954933 RepID=UPI0020928283|nr:glutathione S-transferase family protein [Rhizobium sp. L1K21]MCO6187333.1 glutathione S-transferase family protein [Rhizobium sp. L1K21]